MTTTGSEVPVTISPFTAGAQEYRAEPSEVRADLGLTRLAGGLLFDLTFDVTIVGPCQRCLEDARELVEVTSARVPGGHRRGRGRGDDAVPRGRAARRRPLGHGQRDPRAADRDPLPRGLRGTVPAVRRRPQPRRVWLRAAQGCALGAAARAVVAGLRHVSYASAQYAGPEEEDLEIPPRQAPLSGRAHRRSPWSCARNAARPLARITCAPRARRTRGARSSRSRREHRGHRRA